MSYCLPLFSSFFMFKLNSFTSIDLGNLCMKNGWIQHFFLFCCFFFFIISTLAFVSSFNFNTAQQTDWHTKNTEKKPFKIKWIYNIFFFFYTQKKISGRAMKMKIKKKWEKNIKWYTRTTHTRYSNGANSTNNDIQPTHLALMIN